MPQKITPSWYRCVTFTAWLTCTSPLLPAHEAGLVQPTVVAV